MTPAQAEDFYADAFRELQVLERDLLERGPWSAARQRVATLSTEAGSLLEALGPPARSGDERFKEALNRVELVQSYLGRVALLLDGKAPEPGDVEASPSVLGRLGRLLRRDDE